MNSKSQPIDEAQAHTEIVEDGNRGGDGFAAPAMDPQPLDARSSLTTLPTVADARPSSAAIAAAPKPLTGRRAANAVAKAHTTVVVPHTGACRADRRASAKHVVAQVEATRDRARRATARQTPPARRPQARTQPR